MDGIDSLNPTNLKINDSEKNVEKKYTRSSPNKKH